MTLPEHNKSLGSWLTAFSAETTGMSAWLLMGLPGLAYAAGFQAVWLALGLLLGMYGNWQFVAEPIQRESQHLGNPLTLRDYFARRFANVSNRLHVLMSVFLLVFYAFYLGAGFVLAGRLLQIWLGLDYAITLVLAVGTIFLYVFCSNLWSNSRIDLFSGSLLFLLLLLTAMVGIYLNGGPIGIADSLNAFNPAWIVPWLAPDGEPLGWTGILSLLAWGLGYLGQPQVLARFMVARQSVSIRWWAIMAWGVMLLAAVLIGFIGIGILRIPLQGADAEKVFIDLLLQMFPPIGAAIGLMGILLVAFSVAATQILDSHSGFCAMSISTNQHKNWRGMQCGALVVALAYGLALYPQSTVLALLAHAWAGFGAAFGPLLLLSLYWRGITQTGALAGMATGGASVLLCVGVSGISFNLYEFLLCFGLATLAVVLVSYCGKRV